MAQFYTCLVNIFINMALYLEKDLKFACESGVKNIAACELLEAVEGGYLKLGELYGCGSFHRVN